MLEEITQEVVRSREASAPAIPLAKVQGWMQTTSIDEMGATYDFVTRKDAVSRVVPPLGSTEVVAFLRRYFERCMLENPESDWADSRYSAGWDLAHLLMDWAYFDRSGEDPREWAHWLAAVYKAGGPDVRLAIETATLEHVLITPEMIEVFSEWRGEPELNAALERSLTSAFPLPTLPADQEHNS